ncbi:MAG: hypothetical protein OSB43_12410 [Nocardioides sp.]|uniref:GIY-YIG nuclease family protein n=1 Tax=Nocardioides sp. TaxID=35761 RepID=UPI00238A157E|nr:hypothetical protein [Nocardioides sp.]MDE0777070.1 hypothetical protein [Nocardioides sp.]
MHLESVVAKALVDLAGERHTRAVAVDQVPKDPGLYAFYGDAQAWSALDLSPAFDEQPLYVGKAEKSLNGRDVGTHFSTGKTGSSTVRRSLAALLVEALDLVAVPRNVSRPDGSANYSLEPAGDERLSRWMEERLELATWVKPEDVVLNDVETEVLLRLRPPLNLDKVGEPRERLRRARSVLAAASRSWSA